MKRLNDKISFASLGSKNSCKDRIDLGDLKLNERQAPIPMNRVVQSSRQSNLTDATFKVVKLIGDKCENIQEIINGLRCLCGCKGQFKNILNLLMNKIYRLRDERNCYKHQLEATQKQSLPKPIQTISTSMNTQNEQFYMKEELLRLIEDSKSKIQQSKNQIFKPQLQEQSLYDVLAINHYTSITFDNEIYETNLLSQSNDWQKNNMEQQISRLSFQNSQVGSRALHQFDSNTQPNKLVGLKSYFQKRSLDIGQIENYIEKIHCVKQLEKYQSNKRNRKYC